MYANHAVQMNHDNNMLRNKVLKHSISSRFDHKTNCNGINPSVEYIDKKASKQSNELHLYRNKGEYALIETNNLPFDRDNYTNSPNLNYKIGRPVTDENEVKEPQRYVINNTCKNKHTYKVDNRIQKFLDEKLTSTEIKYDDKATYCRPVINLYNEQFIFKTMERNARLKDLVKKMTMARQREKEKVTWNNFINMLKSKHTANDSNYLEEINDFYDAKWSNNKRSTLCKELLENFYDRNYLYNNELRYDNNQQTPKKYNIFKYGEDLLCYPTSSQGRLIMMRRQQQENQRRGNWGDHASDRNLCCRNGAFTDNNKFHINLNQKASSVQTSFRPLNHFNQNICKDKATNVIDELGKKNTINMEEPDRNVTKVSLQKVGDKLVTLIESINMFIEEIKISKTSMKQNTLNSNICICKEEKKSNLKDAIALTDIEKINKETGADNCAAMFGTHYQVPKNDDLKVPSNSYQIEFEVPTRDCSTGITNSFSNGRPTVTDQNTKEISEIKHNNSFYQPIAIAVNTDPLSFLSLLKLSAETLKSILSCLPILNNYQNQLSLPPGRYNETERPRYVCNICGAGFNKPSSLTNHIFQHNLGITRDSCVCRYVLDNVDRHVSVFRCKYCGKCFNRAYCFELHQNACAKERGQDQDESSDLLLLR